ncbi:MAG: hypothetical protein HZA90_08425 [Verrucomicrobia bacterium]|nr:hypothetical protein [Verrucomicrobiota bacterium]
MNRSKPWLLTALVLAVFLLHQDFWNWSKADPLVLGFLPVGLAYHAAYCALAALMMLVLVKLAWPADLDRIESRLEDERRPPQP